MPPTEDHTAMPATEGRTEISATERRTLMQRIVATSLRFRWIVLFLAAATLAVGFVQIPETKVDVFPEFAPPRVEIQTIALGNSSNEVEELITVPIENQLNGIEGLEDLRSKSVAQLSSIQLFFSRDTDELRARQLVAERLSQITATLPTWASPPFMMPALSATSRIMKIGLTSDTVNLTDMSDIAYWKIRARLLRVPGVAQVAIWGERLPQRHVQVDPAKMAAQDVTLQQVMDTSADALDAGLLRYSDGAVVGTGGFIESGDQRLSIRHVQPITGPRELSQVPVLERDGKTLRLDDIGRVVVDPGPLFGDAVVNDGEGLLLVVQKFRGANTLEVTRGVEQAMAEMTPGLPGIEVDTTIFRPATFIQQSIDNLRTAMLWGIGLVVLILVAFLFEWRTAFISLIAIPLSLVAAVLVLDAAGATVNVMVLAGLVVAVGVVVDDAIIDVENIVRRLRQARAGGSTVSTFRIVLNASVEVRTAITYATLINVVAVVPVLFLEGLSGSFFRPLVLSYGLAVLVSMVVALTVTPALCLLLLSRGKLDHRDSPLLRLLKRAYRALLVPLVRRPLPAVATTLVLLIVGVSAFPLLGSQLLPSFKERDFLMHWLTVPGTSVTEETRVSVSACQDLRQIPGVRNCGSHIGQALLADEVYGVDFGENWISVSPDVDYDQTLDEVKNTVQVYPGLYRDVQTYLRERIKEVLTGTSEAIVVRIYGPDLATLRTQAKDIEKRIGDISGVADAHASFQTDLPHIEVEPKLAAARSHGLTPGDIRRQASTMIASEEVSDIYSGGRAYDVHVTAIPTARDSVTDVENLQLDTPNGKRIRLKDVAEIRMASTPNAIERSNQSRRIDVGANVQDRPLEEVVSEVEQRLAGVTFPLGYHAEVLGESTELDAAEDRLLIFGLAAAVVILLLLQAAFGSFRLAVLTFGLLPMALVGGVITVWLSGGLLSLGSLVGFLAVFGIAARNGILMVSHFQRLEQDEGAPFGRDLVIQGAMERLAPILMTALATGLALVPLVAAGSIPGHEIEHPMAIVIVGGLVTATLLNLFVLPTFYLKFGKSRKYRERAEAERAEAEQAEPATS
ncbi:MAG TPA: efflux RND transporter permease subunit [Propionibacteriaceae bacterium]|nr:efflux RND transporter permease subunit [Propionibacteriaceae bacterium]